MKIWLITVKPKVLRDYGNTVGSSIIVETTSLRDPIKESLVFYTNPVTTDSKERLLMLLKATRQHF